ncbi:hypothetical protein FI667_g1280, partial [Globisporangium splendens]
MGSFGERGDGYEEKETESWSRGNVVCTDNGETPPKHRKSAVGAWELPVTGNQDEEQDDDECAVEDTTVLHYGNADSNLSPTDYEAVQRLQNSDIEAMEPYVEQLLNQDVDTSSDSNVSSLSLNSALESQCCSSASPARSLSWDYPDIAPQRPICDLDPLLVDVTSRFAMGVNMVSVWHGVASSRSISSKHSISESSQSSIEDRSVAASTERGGELSASVEDLDPDGDSLSSISSFNAQSEGCELASPRLID